MTPTTNSLTSAESMTATSAPASEHQEPQGSRDVEVGGEELARRTCSGSIQQFMRSWKTAIRPWSQFFSVSQMSLPPCTDGYVSRLKKNLVHFVGNYFAIATILLLCSIITSFWLLVSSIILCILLFMIRARTMKGPIKVGDEEIPSWILYAGAIFITLPLFIFAHVGYIVYCAIGASIVLILLHATFYENESPKKNEINIESGQSEMTESAQVTAAAAAETEQLTTTSDRPIIRVTDEQSKTRVHFDDRRT